jgi:hypothetical protein
MLPEEKELARLEAEQAELREQVTSAELGLETIKTETTQFQHRYYQTLGRLYAELDEIDARIANLRAKQAPDDPTLTAHAHAAERQAKESAEEAGLNVKKPKPPPVIEPALKQVYRQAVKLMHLSVILLFDVLCFPLFDGPIGEFRKSAPDATQHAVVLAAVKDAARR